MGSGKQNNNSSNTSNRNTRHQHGNSRGGRQYGNNSGHRFSSIRDQIAFEEWEEDRKEQRVADRESKNMERLVLALQTASGGLSNHGGAAPQQQYQQAAAPFNPLNHGQQFTQPAAQPAPSQMDMGYGTAGADHTACHAAKAALQQQLAIVTGQLQLAEAKLQQSNLDRDQATQRFEIGKQQYEALQASSAQQSESITMGRSYCDERQLECQTLRDEIAKLKNDIYQMQLTSVPASGGCYGAIPIPVPPEAGTKRQRIKSLAPDLAARIINSQDAKARNIKKEQWIAVFAALALGTPPPDKQEAAIMLLERLVD